MTLSIAIQMDSIEHIDIKSDSTFVMALEAEARGYKNYHYLAKNLTFKNGKVTALANELNVRYQENNHFTLKDPEIITLTNFDVILMRQDPPFDMTYITATHLLEKIHPKTVVVNNPAEVRNAPEKIFVTEFPDLMPPTLITRNRQEAVHFRTEYKDLIIKPLYGNGGSGIFRIKPNDENFNSLLEMFEAFYREPYILQRYESAVRNGDKRIILIDGKPVGAVNRVPADGESRSNLHVGGTAKKSSLTKRDLEICDAIGPTLKERGLIFVGIDVIGNYITEINVTSPTCIQEINCFNGVNIEKDLWDVIESKVS